MLNLLNRKSNSIVNNKIGNLEKIGDWKNIRNEENLKKNILFNIILVQIKNDLIVFMLLINHILNH